MSTTFDQVVSNPGTGGETWAVEKFTNGSDTISMPVCAIAFGVDGGPFTLVGDDNFPVKVNYALPTGTNTLGSIKLTDGTLTASVRDTGSSDALNVAIVDASGNQVTSFGSSGDVTTTGSSVPSSANYQGINVAGTLRGQTGVNPTGSVYASQVDLASIAGTTTPTGNGTASGAMRVVIANDNSAQAVSQSGTWTVQPGNTANTTAWLVTGTGGTFPATQSGTWNITNISGTISLPTGASTAAKQPALGTAGTASTDVLTVQGIASMTPLLATLSGTNTITSITNVVHVDDNSGSLTVDGTVAATQSGTWNITNVSGTISLPTGASTETSLAKLTIAQGAALGSNTQILTGGSVSTAAPTYTTGQISPLSLTTAGALRVDPSGVTQPVSGTITANAGSGTFTTNVGQLNGTTTDTNSGSKSAGTLRVVLATDQPQLTNSLLTKQQRSTSPTVSSVSSSATNVTILASNSNRLGATVYNDSTQNLYLKLGATASSTSFTVIMVPASYYEIPFNYTGIIDGIWVAANGNARVTELT